MPPPGSPFSQQLPVCLLGLCASFCCVHKFICVIFEIPHKNDIIWYLSLFLTSFTYSGKVKVLPYCCKWHYYIVCCGWVVLQCICALYLLDLSKGTQLVSLSWLPLGVLLWTSGCMQVFEGYFCLEVCPGVRLMDHMVALYFFMKQSYCSSLRLHQHILPLTT